MSESVGHLTVHLCFCAPQLPQIISSSSSHYYFNLGVPLKKPVTFVLVNKHHIDKYVLGSEVLGEA